MADLNETDDWADGVYQLEEDDPVLGGPAGIANLQPKQLASRARFQRLRNITPWVTTLAYPASLAYVSHAGTTWKSVAASTGVEPGTDPTKWVRWAHTEAELADILGDVIAEHVGEEDPHEQYALWSSLSAAIAAAGLVPNRAVPNQLVQALRTNKLIYAADTGAANAYALAFNPAITALADGMVVCFVAAHDNTGPSTLKVNALPAKTLWGAMDQLQGGEIITGCQYMAMYFAADDSFGLIGQNGGALQVSAATKSMHAMQLGQATGRLLRTTVYYNNGGTLYASIDGGAGAVASSTFIPLAATKAVDVEVQGAGGGSGGTVATGANQICASAGAQGGAYARGYFTAGFSGVTVTAGAPGAAGAPNGAGGNGGTSSFGSLVTSPGGLGSGVGPANSYTTGLFAGPQTSQSTPTGGYLRIGTSSGSFSFGIDGGLMVGKGGDTPLGAGGSVLPSGSRGGYGFGAGAAGAGTGQTTAASAGSAGAPGAVIVREYA